MKFNVKVKSGRFSLEELYNFGRIIFLHPRDVITIFKVTHLKKYALSLICRNSVDGVKTV